MTVRPMQIGVIGCGVISSAYLRGIGASSIANVRAVADMVPETARGQAEAFGVRAMSVEALLADPEVELVLNLTVPDAHFDVSRSILGAGKHVYTEKPLCVSFKQGEDLLRYAAERSLRVGSAPDTFLGAAHQASRNVIDNGQIGRVLAGSLCIQSRGMEAWHPNPDFFFRPGGGPVLDLGPYYVTQLVNLLGPVSNVVARCGTGFATRIIGSGPRIGEIIKVEVPTSYSAILLMRSGARITLEASWDVWKHRRVPIELYGTEGTLCVPDPNFFGDYPTVSKRDEDWIDVDISRFAFGEQNRQLRNGKRVADHRSIGVIDMVAGIRSSRPHRASGELALHVLDVLEAISASSQGGCPVDISSTCIQPDPLPFGDGEAVFLDKGSKL